MSQLIADLSDARDAARAQYKIHIIESLDALKGVRREWERLEAASEAYSLCQTYQYCELAAARAIAKGGRVAVAMVYDDAGLQAIWPLAIHRRGILRIANVMTCGNHEEYGGPLMGGRATAPVLAECIHAVMQVPADVLEIPFVQDGSPLQQALESAPQSWVLRLLPGRLTEVPGYSIDLRGFDAWDDFVRTRSQSLRRNLRRYGKGLSSAGCAEFGWCRSLDDAVSVLTWLFANKRRWAEARGLEAEYLMDNEVRDFFIELARRTDLSTVPLVTFIKMDGVPIAASLNVVGPRTLEYWMFTYDEAYSNYSVGNLLTEFVARWAHANNRDLDLGVFFNEYKTYWVNRETSHQTRIVVVSARGRLLEIRLLFYKTYRVMSRRIAAVLGNLQARNLLPFRLKDNA